MRRESHPSRRRWLGFATALPALAALTACAALPGAVPPKVTLAGIEALPGQGLELRALIKLRIQNRGEAALDYDGIAIDLALRGRDLASGVSDARGSVPRFGEVVVGVPVTIGAIALLRQAAAFAREGGGRIDYRLAGRFGGGLIGGQRFSEEGQIDWPAALSAALP
jgi:hypothetical protein